MRAVIQRVKEAAVRVDGRVVGSIGPGLLVLLGVQDGDTHDDLEFVRRKLIQLRLFNDQEGKLNRSLTDVRGEILLVSQFTLFGDCRKGNRPSFSRAAPPDLAEQLYRELAQALQGEGVRVATGIFQAMMEVQLTNDGPVTVILDSKKEFH